MNFFLLSYFVQNKNKILKYTLFERKYLFLYENEFEILYDSTSQQNNQIHDDFINKYSESLSLNNIL